MLRVSIEKGGTERREAEEKEKEGKKGRRVGGKEGRRNVTKNGNQKGVSRWSLFKAERATKGGNEGTTWISRTTQ